MTNITPTQQLFAALKPEDSSSQKAINEATQAAEKRWPLLKSLAPEKWAIAPALSEDEKLRRNRLEPIEVVPRKPAASAPNINAQLANALNRMAAAKPLGVTKDITHAPTTPAQLPTTGSIVKTAPVTAAFTSVLTASIAAQASTHEAEPTTTPVPIFKPASASVVQPSKPSDNSILSVLKRVELANVAEPIDKEKISGFLSRLGKR